MTIDIACPGCGRKLCVSEEFAGKQIRCPACQQISIAPGISENSTEADPAGTVQTDQPATTWHLRMPDGPIYGPIDWDQVLQWVSEGRIAADCELAESPAGPWHIATELLPQLAVTSQQPLSGSAGTIVHGAGPATAEPAGATLDPLNPSINGSAYVAPHRGPIVLVLGILGLCSCPLFSFVAWALGSHDLKEMRAGRMDRSGEGLTMAGMVLGMILSLVWLIAGIATLALIIIAIVSQL
jgi:hypothetical protein